MSLIGPPQPSSSAKLVVPFTSKDLKCVNHCGYFGNPQWQGMCSKCWRDHLKQQHSASSTNEGLAATPDSRIKSSKSIDLTSPNKTWSALGFDKFLEKKTQQTNKRSSTLKSILKKSPSSDNASQLSVATPKSTKKPHSKNLVRQLSDDSLKAKTNFFNFVRSLPGPVAQAVSKEVKLTVDKIFLKHRESSSMDEVSELVQDAYQNISDKLHAITANQITMPCSSGDVMNEVERYICFICYDMLFNPSIDEEEVVDISLQDRIRSLHWVTLGFLDSGIELDKPEVSDSFENAITEIVEMNSKREPQGKLECIVKCSLMLLECLKLSRNGQPASADEFLPALIFVILKCNPPMLQSNINFVARFTLPIKLMSGETGYYFTNLCCALNFVQNLNADSLKMPREEFEAYTSGLALPLFAYNSGAVSGVVGSEAIRGMERSLEEVQSMKNKVEQLLSDMQTTSELQKREMSDLIKKAQSLQVGQTDITTVGGSVSLDDLLGQGGVNNDVILPEPLTPSVVMDNQSKE